jgi:hypothetical protein
MDAILNKTKDQITAGGNVYIIEANETVADFMSRVRDIVKSTTGVVINIRKDGAKTIDEAIKNAATTEAEPELSELEKFRRDLLAAAVKNMPVGKTPLPEMSEEQRAAFEANELSLKGIRDAQKLEKEKLAAEAKAAKAAEKEAAAEALRIAKEAEMAESKATRQADVDLMIAEANKVAETMMAEGIDALQLKVTEFVNGMVEKATHYLNTGSLPSTKKVGKARAASTTSAGDGIDPDPNEVAHIRSLIGSPVSFERNGEVLVGEVQGCGIDRRQGLAMFKLKVDGKTYYKSYARLEDLTIG